MDLTLYHGTDISRVDDILSDGFVCKRNKQHWLGNGIYFYLDKELADWWTSNPTNKFGTKVVNKALLEVNISYPDEKILDLRKLSDYRGCLQALDDYIKNAVANLSYDVEHEMKKLRCAFFDHIFDSYDYDIIIANFTHTDQAYLNDDLSEMVNTMRRFFLNYTETQVCVREGIIEPNAISRC